MESRIFIAAREGKLHELKRILKKKSADEKFSLVSVITEDSTPLLMAAQYGHVNIVKYLILHCHADVEQVGSASVEDEIIEEITPLWCAAAAGHLNVVKFLVQHNASINRVCTSVRCSPLYAACMTGHFEIVKYLLEEEADVELPTESGHTCLMIACLKGFCEIAFYLLDSGADINRECQNGTALHECAKSGNDYLLRWMLRRDAIVTLDSSGKSPLYYAAKMGHEGAVMYLVCRAECTKEEKIEAYELIGTALAEKSEYAKVYSYWNRAMRLRYEDRNRPILKPRAISGLVSYVDESEIVTVTQLKVIKEDPLAIRLQALMIRERITRRKNVLKPVKFLATLYAKEGQYKLSMQLWMYAFIIITPVNSSEVLNYILGEFTSVMSESFSSATGYPSFLDMIQVFERNLMEIQKAMQQYGNGFNRHKISYNILETMFIAVFQLGLMCESDKSPLEKLSLLTEAKKLINLNPKTDQGCGILHIVCDYDFVLLGLFGTDFASTQLEVAKILLEAGANPNAVNYRKSTPLHLAAANEQCANVLFKFLIDNGAHIDARDCIRKTPLEMVQHFPGFVPSLGINPINCMNLQCLSATILKLNNIPYKGIAPPQIEKIIDLH